MVRSNFLSVKRELTLRPPGLRAGPDRFVAGAGAEDGQTAGVHQTEGHPAGIKIFLQKYFDFLLFPPDNAGSERDAGGEEEVPEVSPGVQVGDGHTLVGPGVVAGEGGLLQAELTDPGGAVNTGRVAAALHVHQQHRLVLGGPRLKALRRPQQVHPPGESGGFIVISMFKLTRDCISHAQA